MKVPAPYGLLAELTDADALLAAVRAMRGHGYRSIECYAPFSIEGLAEAAGVRPSRIPAATFVSGALGGIGVYLLQWYSAVVDYPFNSGGRPLNSWQVFILPTFESTLLAAALCAFLAFLIASGLPRLNHPIFGAADFDLAMRNRFFLCIRADDDRFDPTATAALLRTLAPLRIVDVDDA